MAGMIGLSGRGLQLVPADVSLDGVRVNLVSTGVSLVGQGASIIPPHNGEQDIRITNTGDTRVTNTGDTRVTNS